METGQGVKRARDAALDARRQGRWRYLHRHRRRGTEHQTRRGYDGMATRTTTRSPPCIKSMRGSDPDAVMVLAREDDSRWRRSRFIQLRLMFMSRPEDVGARRPHGSCHGVGSAQAAELSAGGSAHTPLPKRASTLQRRTRATPHPSSSRAGRWRSGRTLAVPTSRDASYRGSKGLGTARNRMPHGHPDHSSSKSTWGAIKQRTNKPSDQGVGRRSRNESRNGGAESAQPPRNE